MKQLTKTILFKEISKADIKKFELDNNVILPNYLKDFFYKYNGSRIKEHTYIYNETKYVVEILPLIKNEIDTSVEDILPWIRDEEFMIGRYDMIPFATYLGVRPFLISIGGDDEGVVYLSIVGWGEDKPLRKIADSFEEFINGLHAEDE
jgi:hypothetical protein